MLNDIGYKRAVACPWSALVLRGSVDPRKNHRKTLRSQTIMGPLRKPLREGVRQLDLLVSVHLKRQQPSRVNHVS